MDVFILELPKSEMMFLGEGMTSPLDTDQLCQVPEHVLQVLCMLE